MTIPSRACAHLISAIQAITTAATQTAEGIRPAQVTVTIHRDRALAPDLAPDLTEDLGPTVAAVTTTITEANRRHSSELAARPAIEDWEMTERGDVPDAISPRNLDRFRLAFFARPQLRLPLEFSAIPQILFSAIQQLR